jgi:phage terminase small subunit
MAGVKGRSGGPRKNAGGARPGAGRPKKEQPPPPPPAQTDERDPLKFLLDVMQGTVEANMMQVRAAIAAAQYVHIKKADGGKKDEQAKKAGEVAKRFATAAPPKLVVSNGR